MAGDPGADHPRLAVAVDAVERAARVHREHRGRAPGLTYKSRRDLVTEVDHEAERAIIDAIRARYPDDAILAEESGATGEGPDRWVVDPLDGTTNFVHGFPEYAASVGFERDGRIRIGAIHHTPSGGTFTAAEGRGAFRDGERLAASDVDRVEEALLMTGVGQGGPPADHEFDRLQRATARTHGVRLTGSAATALTAVAGGHLDGFYHHGVQPWDVAAGGLLVEEAGGRAAGIERVPGDPGEVYVAAAAGVFDAVDDLVHG